MENQLTVLSDSLDEKIKVLKEIQDYNRRQEEAFRNDTADMDDFDEAVEEKGRLIEKITRLDDGFDTMYSRLAKELQENPTQYKDQIKTLQEKISVVTELGVTIQAQEARNKKLVEEYFAKARNGVRQSRQNSKAAYDYYKSMSGAGMTQSRFMDSKQ